MKRTTPIWNEWQKKIRSYYSFLSESKWDYKQVNSTTAQEVSRLMANCKTKSGKPTGFIIDESSHLKKGKESVGAARQYAGVSGKVDNCQVAVYGALCNEDYSSLIDTALFLPESWTQDPQRCNKCSIPVTERKFETKPEKALKMIQSGVNNGVQFDWIGGDGLYGHNSELTRGLDAIGLFYVLDVHKDEHIYLTKPTLSIPERKSKRGATPIHLKADTESLRIDAYCQSLDQSQWEEVKVRKTAKGWKKVWVHTAQVWHWDGTEKQAQRRTLVITKTKEQSPKIKYSFSNGEIHEYTQVEYAYFQCSRYWVERCFDDTKNELGLSGYQVRKWIAWQHHQSLVMMASLYMLTLKIELKPEYELISLRDARIMIVAHLFTDDKTVQQYHDSMLKRHAKRKRDIDRYYTNIDEF